MTNTLTYVLTAAEGQFRPNKYIDPLIYVGNHPISGTPSRLLFSYPYYIVT